MQSFLENPDYYKIQKTLKSKVTFSGVGLHTGKKNKVDLHPAPINHGIIFQKRIENKKVLIPAHFESIIATELATSLGLKDTLQSKISTVEHLMAALYGLGIQNVLIEIEGDEIPILDGSSKEFIEGILAGGIEPQMASASVIKIKKPIKVYQNGTVCELLPRENLRLTTSVDFDHPKIGLQVFALEVTPKSFVDQVSRARTFGFMKDLDNLKNRSLALGASLKNALGFTDLEVANPEGLRYWDECVRHKLLDALGDLALCGSYIQGELVSFRGGHSIHHKILSSLKDYPGHWEMEAPRPLHQKDFVTDEPRLFA
jgi:UDP-3-O-[3-hydroxymyristoyl] N-acetylglucosamine deacetylase